MTRTADEVIVTVMVNARQARAEVAAYTQDFERGMGRSSQAVRAHEAQIRASSGAISSLLKGMAAGLAAGFSISAITNMADAYTSLQNRLKAAGLEGRNLAQVEDALFDAANRNGIAVDSVAQLYQRASLSQKALGASQEQLISLTNGVTAALRVQGVSAQEASGPLLQLGQALGAGTVRAEELNSLLEGTPILLQAAAKGSDRFKGDMNALTRAVRDGKVSSQELFQALLKGLPEIERRAASLPKTVGQALQTLNNEIGRYVGQTDKSLSASQRLAQGIEALANNLDRVIPVITTLAVFFGTRWTAALTVAGAQIAINAVNTARYQVALMALMARQTGATTAQVALNAAMTANPIGLVVTAVAALTTGLFLLASRYNTTAVAARELDRVVGAADTALKDYADAVDKARTASKKEREELERKAAALREVTLARIRDAKVEAQRQTDEAVAAGVRAAELRQAAGETRQRNANNVSNAGAAIVGGADARARGAESLAERARREARAATDAYERLKTAMDEVENPRPPGGNSGTTATQETDAERRRRENEAQRQADLRAELDLEGALAAARATGEKAVIDAEEERQRLIQLTARYREAGYADAETRATALLALENRATEIVEERERAEKEVDLILEGRRRHLEREEETNRLLNDQLMDRLGYEAELARLGGSDETVRMAERRLWIEERTNEILRLRLALNQDDARAQAEQEHDTLYGAERVGKMREEFRRSFSEGIRAALDGDVGGFFESLADRFTDRMLDNLADDLFDLLSGAAKGAFSGQGGGILSAIGSIFGGFRANGGPVSAGKGYVVGERGPEYFVPGGSGTIIPNVNGAIAQANRGIGAVTRSHLSVSINLEGANGDETIRQIAYDAAAKGTMAAIAANRADQATAARRARQRFV